MRDYYSLTAELLGSGKKAYIRTYGCQQNVADSERIAGMLEMMGYTVTDDISTADFIIYNTCAIREHAENRVFGNIGAIKKLKEKNRRLIIAVCGCMPQQESVAALFREKYPFVNIIMGTHALPRLPELCYRALNGEKHIVETADSKGEIHEELPIRREGKFRAWLPIMYGCNNFCTYCVVPYVRGRERSRLPQNVTDEARGLIRDGYREITLLGQNVNSYGKDFAKPYPFAQLLRDIDSIEGDFILRFMTSHPRDASRELIDTIAGGKHIAHQLHLPVQSGSSEILRAMNRHYDREAYLEIAKYAREKIPDLTISTDIIVGFPGETEEDFKETLSLVREVGFDAMFAFCYSRRRGTPADKMENQIPQEIASERFGRLMKLQEEIAGERNSRLVGQKLRVLPDGIRETDSTHLSARTEGNIMVDIEGDKSNIGSFRYAVITESQPWMLKGVFAED